MSADKRGCSALRLKRIAYDTEWTMSHEIYNAMKKRDEDYQLSGYVEIDEYFSALPYAEDMFGG